MTYRASTDLNSFLGAYRFHCEFDETWPVQGKMRVRLGLASELPPVAVSSSILSIVVSPPGKVLCLYPDENGGNIHQLLIGGRPKEGETPEETVNREVLEETGWLITPVSLIGFRHFHQLQPRSEESDRPYPDFIQPIFASRAVRHDSQGVIAEDLIASRMIPFAQARSNLPLEQHPLLLAAMEAVSTLSA